MEPRPTIYDVAKAAGVAASTVSRAFARPGRVNAETAARVFAAARELGYRTTPLPGLTSVAHPHRWRWWSRTSPTRSTRRSSGARTRRPPTWATPSACRTPRRTRTSSGRGSSTSCRRVEGVVLASSRMSDSTIRTLAKQKPVVVLNRRLPEVPCLLVDNARGMRRAMEHLGELGHTSVTYVSGPESSWTDGVRWQALREAGFELEMKVRRVGPTPGADDRRRLRPRARDPGPADDGRDRLQRRAGDRRDQGAAPARASPCPTTSASSASTTSCSPQVRRARADDRGLPAARAG